MNQITKKSLRSTIWLGSAGALLIVGGMSALLASNWAYLPLPLQIIIAFTPLVCSWVGYLWLSYHKTASLAQEEILKEKYFSVIQLFALSNLPFFRRYNRGHYKLGISLF